MRKIIYILVLFLTLSFIDNVNAFDTSLKVYDYAQLLTEEEEDNLKKDIDLFIANNNIDMVLITVKHHGMETTKEYADKFYDTHGFGIGELKSGIVGVVDLGSNTFTITKYGSAIENFTNDITNKISNKVNNKYKKGYYKMLDSFVGEIYDYSYSKHNTFLNLGYNVIKILKLIAISLIITIIVSIVLIIKSRNKKEKNIVYKDYIVKDSLEINKKQEKFITTQTKTNKIITKKKGFTLIELLAVIVILAIIALIATPIVLNIINETKESANLRSAEMYLKAVEYTVADAIINGGLENKEYPIATNGDLCKIQLSNGICPDGNELKVEVKGEKPNSGSIWIENGNIGSVTLNLNEKTIVKKEKGELIYHPCTLIDDVDNSNSVTPGDEYSCKVDPNEKAYTFYVLSDGEKGTTNLIMDRNVYYDEATNTRGLTDENHLGTVAWINQEDYETVSDNSWDDWEDNNSYGPITAMNYLEKATSSWTNLEKMTINIFDDNIGTPRSMAKTYNVYARLPRLDEVQGTDKCLLPSENGYGSCPLYLVNYLNSSSYVRGEGLQNINGIYGYWTLSSSADSSYFGWRVYCSGYVQSYNVGLDDSIGVRPVINIKL